VYCGAIGYSSPHGRAVFSVPIRTLRRERGTPFWHYGVGSGIVWDSAADGEWHECANKCEVLTSARPQFMIFESMLVARGAVRYQREHGMRMAEAAAYFDIPFQRAAWRRVTDGIRKRFQTLSRSYKVRVFLSGTGGMQWDFDAIGPDLPGPQCRVLLSDTPVDERSPFLFHKTTFRPWYDEAMRQIRQGRCFDMIHLNSRGQLTEGARSNIFLEIKGTLFTPPVECGLLPGILRRRMLARKRCCERMLYPSDLRQAEAVFCGNSVRGLVRVTVEGGGS
ncbi:MAG: aminotransferase class IV, partial [Chitinispirillaceae bacterium]|nr:aminotransferase class IV [Chitinispirillaceae bacterium]